MRIAIVSCINAQVFPDQPVWEWIAARQPDHLVLLGDTIYLDVPLAGLHPIDMGEDGFAHHLFERYRAQLAQPQFEALVRGLGPGRVWSIWDDHDFLWNDACGARERRNPAHAAKIRLSTAFQRVFRDAIAQGLGPGAFPAAYDDVGFWDANEPGLATPSVAITPDLWLHLGDVRSERTDTFLVPQSRRALLGAAQRTRIGAEIRARPAAVHLLASGSVLSAWKRYDDDWQWLLGLAAVQRTLVLSGDIHRNDTDAFFTGGYPLHEATSSGLAVRDAVVIGRRRRNFGLVDIDAATVRLSFYADGREQPGLRRTLDRQRWMPV